MTQILNWTADAVLILLLGSTLVLALRLDRALRMVGGDRAAFEALVNSLGAATNAVKLGVQTLRSEAERAASQLEQRSQDADKMATDLSFLIEAADRAGGRLERRLDDAPAVAAATSRLAEAVRELRGTRRYVRQKPDHAAGYPGASAAVPEVLSEPLAAPGPEPVCHVATPVVVDGAPANLRQLAGITTRRRAPDHADAAQHEAAFEAAHIKLVG